MDFLREWLLGVTCAAMVVALAESLAPEGGAKRVCRLAGGLVLLLAAISPVIRAEPVDLSALLDDYIAVSQNYTEELEEKNEVLYETIIVENTAAYILDKAEQLGISCWVSVTVARDEDGVPYPDTVRVTGELTEEQISRLSRMLETELGVAPQRQYMERTQP